jgi:hypothetical protein
MIGAEMPVDACSAPASAPTAGDHCEARFEKARTGVGQYGGADQRSRQRADQHFLQLRHLAGTGAMGIGGIEVQDDRGNDHRQHRLLDADEAREHRNADQRQSHAHHALGQSTQAERQGDDSELLERQR